MGVLCRKLSIPLFTDDETAALLEYAENHGTDLCLPGATEGRKEWLPRTCFAYDYQNWNDTGGTTIKPAIRHLSVFYRH